MTCPSHRRLSIPAWLAVGSLGAATACGGDDGSTTAADTSADDAADDGSSSAGPSTADDSAESSSASGSTTAPSESSGDAESTTRGDDSGTSGGDYCFGDGSNPACDVTEQPACEGVEICVWSEPGYCGANCTAITDRATCCEQLECEWQFGACDYGAI
jgi:hypothetical protein